MSELMTPIPFRELMTWITTEYRRDGAVFGVHKPYKAGVKKLPIFGETIETPFGPAAGPNTQLAQNIIAGYFAGARFFELKTVQKMDGADLAACINRPCILAEDECYNCEWSTELYVQQAFEEYVKAWCALKIMAKVYGLGDPNGFVFNMSVGYDLAGIQGEKIDTFLNGMVDASKTPIFQECIAVLKEFFPGESDYIDTITPHVSGSVTVSTLHGCPPDEIERIASYLLEKKHLHTFVKCNPTILGYETARSILDSMGYDYIAFDDHHFKEDLQYSDAVPMFHRLQALADREGLEFGLKLSNTFPVDVKAGELPSEEMYMAGKSLFPLTTTMAAMMAKEFGGKLRLSYAGGADAFNIDKLFACGIWPITMATTELKPGGYQRFTQIGDKLDALDFKPFTGVDVVGIEALSLAELKAQGYTHIFFAVGAWKAGRLDIPGNVVPVIGWLRDMKAGKDVSLGHVAVVGGGNTAMDAARAALRAGAKSSTLVYRRTKKYMPADAEELEMAIADGVEFLELVAPVEQKDGKLICEKMKLGDPDDKGRRQPVPTGEMVEIPCDTVVSAVGEKVESEVFTRNGITVDEKGIPAFKTNLEGVYAGGDAMRGPATVVEGIADAQYFANAVIGEAHKFAIPAKAVATREEAVAKKGVLCESAKCEGDRCLTCNVVCQVCADVCPNRANVVIELPDGRQQILHVDRMCNECGNCAVFCPYDSAPYREKFTLFLTREGFDESVNNQGFLPLGGKKVLVRLDSKVFEADLDAKNDLPADIEVFIWTVLTKYAYLMG